MKYHQDLSFIIYILDIITIYFKGIPHKNPTMVPGVTVRTRYEARQGHHLETVAVPRAVTSDVRPRKREGVVTESGA